MLRIGTFSPAKRARTPPLGRYGVLDQNVVDAAVRLGALVFVATTAPCELDTGHGVSALRISSVNGAPVSGRSIGCSYRRKRKSDEKPEERSSTPIRGNAELVVFARRADLSNGGVTQSTATPAAANTPAAPAIGAAFLTRAARCLPADFPTASALHALCAAIRRMLRHGFANSVAVRLVRPIASPLHHGRPKRHSDHREEPMFARVFHCGRQIRGSWSRTVPRRVRPGPCDSHPAQLLVGRRMRVADSVGFHDRPPALLARPTAGSGRRDATRRTSESCGHNNRAGWAPRWAGHWPHHVWVELHTTVGERENGADLGF